ncbi:MAG TPA: hypothetical protein VH678_08315 [Xanthobacteraceae bacterium]|jgi:hypothetical protein
MTVTTSKTIAALIGPTLIVIALAMLFNLGSFAAMMDQVSRDPALIFLSGVLLFVAGLAILRAHNIWAGGWPVLISILGALAILGGLGRMFFPVRLAEVAVQIGQRRSVVVIAMIVFLALGGFLSVKAYSRDG